MQRIFDKTASVRRGKEAIGVGTPRRMNNLSAAPDERFIRRIRVDIASRLAVITTSCLSGTSSTN